MAKWPCWKSGRPGPYCWLVNGSGIILMEDERCKKWVLTGLKLVTVVKLSFFFLFIFSRIAPRQLLESTCLHVILLFPLESWEDSFFSIKLIFSLISGWTIEVVKCWLSSVSFWRGGRPVFKFLIVWLICKMTLFSSLLSIYIQVAQLFILHGRFWKY